jgi:hypothetical protein
MLAQLKVSAETRRWIMQSHAGEFPLGLF